MNEVRATVDLLHPVDEVWRALSSLPFEVIAARPPHRLVHRLQDKQLHTEVVWELTQVEDGCHVAATQSGYFGLGGERREQARAALESIVRGLPALLGSPSPKAAPAVGIASVPGQAWQEPKPKRWRAITAMPGERRVALLSVVGAMVLTVLVATGIATLGWPLGHAPADVLPAYHGPAQLQQPASAPSLLSGTAQPSPTAGHSFQTSEPVEGGYVGSITVQGGPGGLTGWTARLELPDGSVATSAWDQVSFQQNGRFVVFKPESVHREIQPGSTFTFSFQVKGTGRPLSCSVNGSPCVGLVV